MARRGVYVETRVRGDMARLWTLTQAPVQHARWDARFTTIEHLPTPEGDPQRFRYAVTLLPGADPRRGGSQRR